MVAKATGLDPDRMNTVKRARSLNNADLCTMPEAALERAIWRTENPRPDHPGEWAAFRAMQQRDERGVVRADGLIVAGQARRAILDRRPGAAGQRTTGGTTNTTSVAGAPAAATVAASSLAWQELGPGNIGGRVRSIVIHPTQPTTLFVGAVAGGVWTSTDAGATWRPVNDFMGNLAVSTLAMSPADPSVIYAGTGEGF